MQMTDHIEIGLNAGKVWRALNEASNGMTFKELEEQLQLSPLDVAGAIGWLARENKIVFSQREDEVEIYSIFREVYF